MIDSTLACAECTQWIAQILPPYPLTARSLHFPFRSTFYCTGAHTIALSQDYGEEQTALLSISYRVCHRVHVLLNLPPTISRITAPATLITSHFHHAELWFRVESFTRIWFTQKQESGPVMDSLPWSRWLIILISDAIGFLIPAARWTWGHIVWARISATLFQFVSLSEYRGFSLVPRNDRNDRHEAILFLDHFD